jgi:hypothetical protein
VVHRDGAAHVAEKLPFQTARIYYVMGREWLSDPDAALREALGQRYQACSGTSVRGIRILCLRREHGGARRQTAHGKGSSRAGEPS